ncbi:MAG TPA: MFS transporter [Thermoflexales bacterium]|mgnify:CR=1 FL=1|nr:MFS transporter [Thermoflexales bacterium]
MFRSKSGGAGSPKASGNGALAFVFITIFIDMLGVGILIPVTAYIVRQYSTDAFTVGLLTVSYSFFQFFASPLLGQISDRYGRRPVLLLSLFGTAIGYFVFGVGGALWVLFAARIIDGITGGNISIAQAYIADVTPPQERSKAFGLIGAAFSLGFIIGPALGGVLSNISLSAPAFFAGFLALFNVVLGYFMLPESLPPEKRTTAPLNIANVNPITGILDVMRKPVLPILLLAVFAYNFAFAGLQSNFSLYTLERFQWSPNQNALLFSVIGLVGIVMQGFLVRRLIPIFGDRRLATVGLGLMALSFFGVAFIPEGWMLFLVCIVMAVGSGLSTPTLTGMISNSVSPREQGSILGVTQSVNSLTRIFGPLWAGFAFDALGMPSPYWSGALFILLALGLVMAYRNATRSPDPKPASA